MTRTRAPKKEKRAGANKTGPKRVFTEEDLRNVEYLAMLGLTDMEMAGFFGVGRTSIEYWTKHYEEFAAAKKRGGLVADMKVVKSLYRRAVGYTYTEKEFTAITTPDGDPIPIEQMAMVKVTKKRMAPNVGAAIRWLSVRQRQTWMTTQTLEVNGSVQHVHKKVDELPLEELSKEAQKLVFEIARKQLSTGARDN